MFQTIVDPQAQFALLIAALSEEINTQLDASEGMVVLVDDKQSLRMIIELSTDKDSLYMILPVMPIPDDPVVMGELAMQALLLNADRAALSGACICADAHHSTYCLIRQLPLTLDAAAFIEACQDTAVLAGLVKEYLQLPDADADNELKSMQIRELSLKS